MTRTRLICLMDRRPLRRVDDLLERAVTQRAIQRAVEKGHLVRPFRGLVALPDAHLHEHFTWACALLVTGGVIANATAAFEHGLTDERPDTLDVIARRARARPADQPWVRMIRSDLDEAHQVGIRRFGALGSMLRITTPARTLVDMYRLGGGAFRDGETEACRRFLMQGYLPAEALAVAAHFDRFPTDRLKHDLEANLNAVAAFGA